MEIVNSKNLLIEAHDYEADRFFIAWEMPDSKIISIEYHNGNTPAITVHSFKDKDEFISSITWHFWIKGNDKNSNIKDHYIKFRV